MPKLKMIKTLPIILVALCVISCEKSSNSLDLIGNWKWWRYSELNPDVVFEFNQNDTLVIFAEGDSSFYNYTFYSDNTIKIEYGTRVDRNEIIVYSNDSIEILEFTISGVPEERNTVLIRTQ